MRNPRESSTVESIFSAYRMLTLSAEHRNTSYQEVPKLAERQSPQNLAPERKAYRKTKVIYILSKRNLDSWT